MKTYEFPQNFLWGAAASGPQTEGNTNKANLNVWDHWFNTEPDRFFNHWSSAVACDTYNRYQEDAKLMSDINMNSFRTSIQWARLMKDVERGEVDPDAVEFYNNYINAMIENGVEVIMNLYHFDMPFILQEKFGGFENKHVVELYAQYAKTCFELFGDRVKYFTTFNEPIVCVEGSYFYDFHYPNKIDSKLGIQVGYNLQLAHAKAVKAYRELNLGGEIGITLNLTPAYPRSNNPADLRAAEYADAFNNKSYVDPAVKGTFPELVVTTLRENGLLPETTQAELDIIKENTVDFLGINYYVPLRVCAPAHAHNPESPWNPHIYFDYYAMPGSRNNPHRDNNEIYPRAIYDIAKNIQNEYGNIKWYVAEIGISMTNEESLIDPETNMIDDSFRTNLLIEHLVQLHKAIEEGTNCFGVHQWTFIDNWSWLNSHKRRYGFYYLDLETRDRHIKKHALWFKELAKNNSFTV